MLYAQSTESPCCGQKPTAAAPSPSPVALPHPAPPAPPPAPPRIATAAETQSLAADAPTTAQSFQFSLPAGVAPENGLQVKTIWAARAISLLFPQITTIGGYRQDALKWHPNGLAIDVMIPNHNSLEGIELGDQIAGYALANAKRWGVDHVIWRQKIYPGIGRAKLDGKPRERNRQPLRPRAYRNRWRRLPEGPRDLLHRIDEPDAASLIETVVETHATVRHPGRLKGGSR